MVTIDTLEGLINHVLWYHYDVRNDVLYLRLDSFRDVPTVGEETDDGLILMRRRDDDQQIGLTIVNWWKRFGKGILPDSISEIQKQIEPFAGRLAA